MTDQTLLPVQRRLWRRAGLAAALLVSTTLGGFAIGYADVPATPGVAVNPPGAEVAPQPLPDFTTLVTRVKPAVVSITTTLRPTEAAMEDDGQAGPMPQLPFPFNQMVPRQHQPSRGGEARGSGFIIDANGTIVTNNHVVKDARSVTVTLDDGTTLPAKVIGRDPRTDIAVLRIEAGHPLPFIQLGNSAQVKPGEWVVAMGNPFGLGGTVTAGIVSAVSRDIGSGPYDQFIQIDAPINQGNSGGPLFTQDGKVIGMNSAILSPSGGSVGIGFAIPSDMIRTVAAQLEQSGHVVRGYVGVEAQPVTGATAKMTIPSPAVLHFRGGRRAISKQLYPDLEGFYEDLAKTYRKAVKAFYDAGCRYLQFDDTVWAYLCSQDELKKARERGDNPDGLQEIYARIINYAIAERPADMTITTHVCRGNFRSTWISSGGYEPVAETMLAGTNYDGYFLEYDSERAGGFEPLRYLPKGNKIVVVGVITSKSGALEKKDDIKRRLEEASKYAPLDQLAVSPQCGFASTEEGNLLTEEEQWAKLKLAVDVANEVWGK